MSRRNFIRRSAAQAAALSGLAAASGYRPERETVPLQPDPDIQVHGNAVFVYPSGHSATDYANLQLVVSSTYYPKNICLMASSRSGIDEGFVLPEGASIILTRDGLEITGNGNPNGRNATIREGYIAFRNSGSFSVSVSISKITFLNQDFGAVYGHFEDFIFENNQVAVDPMPPPNPNYGIFLESVSRMLRIRNNEFLGWTGIVCKAAGMGEISFNMINSIDCGIYASDILNAELKGNIVNVSDPGFDTYVLANIIIGAGSDNSIIKAGKLEGSPYFGIVLLGRASENSGGNQILMLDVKNLNCSLASVAINALNQGTLSDIIVKAGPGSVGVDPMPPPDPRKTVLDNGYHTSAIGFAHVENGMGLPEEFRSGLENFLFKIEYPFEYEGNTE